jgi:hypothetical protein
MWLLTTDKYFCKQGTSVVKVLPQDGDRVNASALKVECQVASKLLLPLERLNGVNNPVPKLQI